MSGSVFAIRSAKALLQPSASIFPTGSLDTSRRSGTPALDHRGDTLHQRSRARADREHLAVRPLRASEHPLRGGDLLVLEIVAGTSQRLNVGEREAEAVHVPIGPLRTFVRV